MFEHLDEIKPALKKLVEVLRQEYAYASVLASDSDERNWGISRSGSSLSTNGLSRDGGFVVRFFDQTGCGEYSFNRFSEAMIPEICRKLRENLKAAAGSLPEGVSFSIIIMNILVPHIERLTTPKPFGAVKEKKQKKEAAE